MANFPASAPSRGLSVAARAPLPGVPVAHGQSPAVDPVAVDERVAALAKRSIKKASKVTGLRLAIRMMDLTTLEGKDTPGKVRALCRKAVAPMESDPTTPSCA